MFEWMFRDEVGLSVDILNPTEFPTGSLFFDHHNSVYKDSGEIVFMVHNNFIIGSEKKVERFKKYNMWLEDSYLKNLDYGSTEFKVLGQSVPTLKLGELSIDFQKPEGREDYFEVYKNQPVLMYVNDDLPVEEQRERVIVSISTGGRKWFDLYVLPRLKDYAVKTRSSILLVRRQTECDRFNDVVYDSWKDSRRETVDEKPGGERSFDDGDYLYHDCVKAGKVRVWGEVSSQALGKYLVVLPTYSNDPIVRATGSETLRERSIRRRHSSHIQERARHLRLCRRKRLRRSRRGRSSTSLGERSLHESRVQPLQQHFFRSLQRRA